MSRKIKAFLLTLALSCIMLPVLPAYAGFQLEEAYVTEDLGFELLDAQEIGTSITSFDVSERNWTAVGFSNKCISIYDENCDPVMHFTINTSGGAYYVEWAEDDLCVHIVRDDLSVKLSMDGEIISCSSIPYTDENRQYWNLLRERESVTVNDISYHNSGNAVIQTSEDGAETAIVSTAETAKAVHLTGAALFGFMFLMLLVLVGICVSERKGTKEEEEYPLTIRGFMQIRPSLWTFGRNEENTEHPHSSENCDE